MDQKILAFEYIIHSLCDWYKDVTNMYENDFSKLKIFKLHFFVCAVRASKNNSEKDLLNTFNKFYALPYGPVESDIYNRLNETNMFKFGDKNITVKSSSNQSFVSLETSLITEIDKSIIELRSKNPDLVKYDAFKLVDISHEWLVWKMTYNKALKNGKRSEAMPADLIRESSKFFNL